MRNQPKMTVVRRLALVLVTCGLLVAAGQSAQAGEAPHCGSYGWDFVGYGPAFGSAVETSIYVKPVSGDYADVCFTSWKYSSSNTRTVKIIIDPDWRSAYSKSGTSRLLDLKVRIAPYHCVGAAVDYAGSRKYFPRVCN